MSKLAEEILKASKSWKPDGVNFPLTDEEKLALIDEKLSGVKCINCHNAPDEANRAVICRKCYVVNSKLKAERDKAIEVLAQVQASLKVD